MDGWTILIWGTVCGGGVLAFLRVVACEVEHAAQDLTRVELLMKRAAERDSDAGDDEIVDAISE